MTYDSGERDLLYAKLNIAIASAKRLRASHDALLAAAKMATPWVPSDVWRALQAAIAKAEEPSEETAARDHMDRHPHATVAKEKEL